jgi:DNA-binding MarR family transcriptional regulator
MAYIELTVEEYFERLNKREEAIESSMEFDKSLNLLSSKSQGYNMIQTKARIRRELENKTGQGKFRMTDVAKRHDVSEATVKRIINDMIDKDEVIKISYRSGIELKEVQHGI